MPIDANGTRHVIKITFENGDTVVSRINGTKEEILRYYIGTTFNLGREADLMVKAIAVDFLEE